jgi:hypothetical protein
VTLRLSALPAGRPLPPERFVVLISVKRPSWPQGHSGGGRIRSIDESSDRKSNTDLPACRIVLLCLCTVIRIEISSSLSPWILRLWSSSVWHTAVWYMCGSILEEPFVCGFRVYVSEILVHVNHTTTYQVQKTLNSVHRYSSRLEVTVPRPWKEVRRLVGMMLV